MGKHMNSNVEAVYCVHTWTDSFQSVSNINSVLWCTDIMSIVMSAVNKCKKIFIYIVEKVLKIAWTMSQHVEKHEGRKEKLEGTKYLKILNNL